MNSYTVTITDGTNTAVYKPSARSHREAAEIALDTAVAEFAIVDQAATLTITVTQP